MVKRTLINWLVETLANVSYWLGHVSDRVIIIAEWLNDYHGDGRDDEYT